MNSEQNLMNITEYKNYRIISQNYRKIMLEGTSAGL